MFRASDRTFTHGRAASLCQDGDRLRVTDDAGPGGVFGRLRRVGSTGNQQAEGGRVPPCSHRRRDLVVDGLTEQRVGELHPTRGIGFEQASPTERLKRAVALSGGEGRQRRRDPGTKPTPQDARRLRASSLFGRGTDEPGAQERGPGGRHINTGFRKVAATPDTGRDLLEQEGVACRQPGCPPGRGRGDLPAGAIAQHIRRTGVAQRQQLFHGRFTIIGKRTDCIQSALRPGPKGPDQGDRQIADPATEEGKQRQRVVIRPVKVVKEQQGWRRQCFEKLKSRIEARRAGLHGGAPAGPRLAGAPEPKSSQCLVDDSKREARFGGIAPSDADLEATA